MSAPKLGKIADRMRDMLEDLAKVVADPASIEITKYERDTFACEERLEAKLANGDSIRLARRIPEEAP